MADRSMKIAAIGVGLVVLVFGGIQVSARVKADARVRDEITGPASGLSAARKKAEALKISLPPSLSVQDEREESQFTREITTDAVLKQSFRRPSVNSGEQLIRNTAFRQTLTAATTGEIQMGVIGRRDILSSPNVAMNKSMSASLTGYARKQMSQGNPAGALDAIELAKTLSMVSGRDGHPNHLVVWFGIQLDVSRLTYEMIQADQLKGADRQRAIALLEDATDIADLSAVINRMTQEIVAATRVVDSYDLLELGTLNSEGRNQEPPDDHPQMKAAMETRLLEFFTEAQEISLGANHAEAAGMGIDAALGRAHEDDSASNYMVRTLGQTYEQYGRMIHRVQQSRAVLLAILKDLPYDSKTMMIGDTLIGIDHVEVDGRHEWVAKSPSPDKFQYDRPIEINQLAGVRVVAP